jgi:hypothetical protein
MVMRVLACLLLLLAVPAVQAQMYKCKDERGRWVFSDKPLPGCADAPETSGANSPAPQSPPAAKSAVPAKSATPQSPPSAARKAPPPGAKLPPGLSGLKGPPSKTAKPAAPPRQTISAPTEHDKKYARAQCRTLKEEETWLANPRNAGVEARDARLGQVRQALADCR